MQTTLWYVQTQQDVQCENCLVRLRRRWGVTLRSIQGTYVARMVVIQGCVEWHTPQGLCHELWNIVAMCDTQDACVVSCSFYVILLVNLYQVSLFNFLYLLSDVFVRVQKVHVIVLHLKWQPIELSLLHCIQDLVCNIRKQWHFNNCTN